jgi:hypothetical protein
MELVQHVVLIDATGHIADNVVEDVAKAINEQVQSDFWKVWRIRGKVTALSHAGLLQPCMWPVFIVSETLDESAGFHKFSCGQPYAEVTEASGYDWSIAASHEVLEMLADPSGSRLVPGRGIKLENGDVKNTEDTFAYLLEICDPSESPDFAYQKRITRDDGTVQDIWVSDFYTPSFFHEGTIPAKGKKLQYSWTNALTEPRRVRQGGYLTWWDPCEREMRQLDHTGDELRLNDLPSPPRQISLREHSDQNTRSRVRLVRKQGP